MIEKIERTFYANIYIGLKEGYQGPLHDISEVSRIAEEWCAKLNTCVTVTATNFVYRSGKEPGAIVGMINYPRRPSTQGKIRKEAKELARILMKTLHQHRCSIVFPDNTIMFDAETV